MLNRTGKVRQYRNTGTGPDLENHFILRLPEHAAQILKEDLKQGQTNIKDRLFLELNHTQDKDDMRNGRVTLDTVIYNARLVDLPTIMETYKTIDGKNFYKTADVCQMLMIKEDEDPPEEEELKKKKRDPNKVERKYLWPHGYTPPLKNIRKRRFRRTLRKKNLDLPDVEKEVKRLLRTDNEAIKVEWEVVREDDEKKMDTQDKQPSNVNNKELFGELSSSEDEGAGGMMQDLDDDSRLSVEDSRFTPNDTANSVLSKAGPSSSPHQELVTEFTSAMFKNMEFAVKTEPLSPPKDMDSVKESLYGELTDLQCELNRLLAQKAEDEAKVATIENMTLKHKFLKTIVAVEDQIKDKENAIREIRRQLQS